MISMDNDQFLHRVNYDGSVDSICMCCFQTIASLRSGAVLADAEHQHKCDGPPLFISPRPEHSFALTAAHIEREA
jgi:hypothetical protein